MTVRCTYSFAFTEGPDAAHYCPYVTFSGPGLASRESSFHFRVSLTDAECILDMLQAAFEAGKRVRSGEILTMLKGDVAEGMR